MRSACGGSEVGDENPDEPDFGAMFKPHRPQKREFSGSGEEHLGHGNIFVESPAVTTAKDRPPHRPQNFTPSAKREWQFVQATMPGMTLEWIPLLPLPWDGVG